MARGKQAELDFHFSLPGAANSESFVDIGQVYSLVNRLSVRQGMQYAVSGIVVTGASNTIITIDRLPEHWPCINAWEKSYHIWRESQQQVLDENPGIGGRWRDFKIYMNQTHQNAGVVGNLLPTHYFISGFPAGDFTYDWDPSEIQIPNDPTPALTEGYNLHMIGSSNAASKGMITGYAASRARPSPNDPNIVDSATTTEGWMIEAFDVGENLEEIREDLDDENDQPPYVLGKPGGAESFYPGGMMQGAALTQEATLFTRDGIGTQTRTGAFTAPCGLLRFTAASDDTTEVSVRIELMPGSYKGCMARPMQDVN